MGEGHRNPSGETGIGSRFNKVEGGRRKLGRYKRAKHPWVKPRQILDRRRKKGKKKKKKVPITGHVWEKADINHWKNRKVAKKH